MRDMRGLPAQWRCCAKYQQANPVRATVGRYCLYHKDRYLSIGGLLCFVIHPPLIEVGDFSLNFVKALSHANRNAQRFILNAYALSTGCPALRVFVCRQALA